MAAFGSDAVFLTTSDFTGFAPLGACLFRFADELVRFFLRHLAATDHVLDEVSCAFDCKRGETCRRTDDVAKGAGHLAAGLEADFMGTRGQLRHRVANVLAAMARTALWWDWWRLRRLAGRWGALSFGPADSVIVADGGRPSAGGFVRSCRVSHLRPVQAGLDWSRGFQWVLCGAKYMLT